jgi:thiamine biosynthesis lipoprotein
MKAAIGSRHSLVTWIALPCVALAAPGLSLAGVERSGGGIVMGTVFQATVAAQTPALAGAMANRAVELARRWDDVLTIWREEGELARLNSRAGKGPIEISSELAVALSAMQRYTRDTQGAFEPGVAASVRHHSTIDARAASAPTVSNVLHDLRLTAGHAELAPGAALDSGGIGKGIALDAIADELRRAPGVTGAYVNFGNSSQLAFGTRADGSPWRIALSGLDERHVHGVIVLDGAISSSRSRSSGDEAGPIVDPATGDVVAAARFATCLAASAAEADAWSTAIVVLGARAIADAERRSLAVLYEEPGSVLVSARLASAVSDAAEHRALE